MLHSVQQLRWQELSGDSQSTVSRIWRNFGLKPQLIEYCKISNDPNFSSKVRDVVGLYLNPPEAALVLSVDEKTKIQALEGRQTVLPMTPFVPERQTHEYIRQGTTNLYAALEAESGNVTTKTTTAQRAVEFISSLDLTDKEIPKDLEVHLIMDNYVTHKTDTVRKWNLEH